MKFRRLPAGYLMMITLAPFSWAQSYTVNTVAGLPTSGVIGAGTATNVNIGIPSGLAVDSTGNLYIADGGSAIYKVTPAGTLSTIAGNPFTPGYSGDGGQAVNALLDIPMDLALDSAGNLYVVTFGDGRVRKISTSGIITTVAGGGAPAFPSIGDGLPATKATLSFPLGLAIDNAGNLYIADSNELRIRKVTTDGIIHTVAGNGACCFGGDGGPATSANLYLPSGVTVDTAGNIYIADTLNNRIRKVSTDGIISTFAGNGAGSFSGEGGPATSAGLYQPRNVRLDSAGNLYIAAAGDQRVRLVTTSGIINTIAGNGAVGFTGDGGPATNARFNGPYGVAITPQGVIYVADSQNGRVRALNATPNGPYGFTPITPCRVLDTRNPNGAFGGPKMAANTIREFDVPSNSCQIPSTATAYSLNVTVVPDASLSYLSIWPSGQGQPYVSTLNSDGRVKANAAIVPAGTNGGIDIYVTDATQVVIDIDGYFTSQSSSALQFYPLTPCRVADTRNANGPLGGPYMAAGQARSFPVLSSACSVPAIAQAYSLNFTVVPHVPVSFLSAWPAGQPQPLASVLNASTGSITANAAIVPAGTSQGGVSVFSTDDTDLVIDINGYFAPPAAGRLNLYTIPPCRTIDTRTSSASSIFPGTLPVNITGSGCTAPSSAQAFVLNATVVPIGALSYLSLWPDGQTKPIVSTLNADNATVTSNMAIVPTSNGSIDAYATDPTWLILDLASYFAP